MRGHLRKRGETARDVPVLTGTVTVADVTTSWLEARTPHFEPSTVSGYQVAINQLERATRDHA